MLHAIGIYSISGEKLDSAQKSNNQFFPTNDLELLERTSLQKVLQEQLLGSQCFIEVDDHGLKDKESKNDARKDLEYHYLYNLSNKKILAISSRKEIDSKELKYLFININHAHVRSGKIKTSLKDILINPQGFIKEDIMFRAIDEQNEDTIKIMKDNIELVLHNREHIKELDNKTIKLSEHASLFDDKAKELHNSYKCCRYM